MHHIEEIFRKIILGIFSRMKKYKFLSATVVIFIFFIVPIICTKGVFKIGIQKLFNNNENAIGYLQYIGSIIGGLATMIALYVTVNQTREIQEENKDLQERLIKLEEDKRKFGLRTNFQEFIVKSDIELNKYIRTLEGSMLILTEEYKYMNDVLNNGVEYFKINTKIVNGAKTRFADIAELDSTINYLNNFNSYIFEAISNIGNNTMYNVGIKMGGLWFQADNQKYESGEIEFSIEYIGKSKTILLPLFKLDDELMLWQFSPERVTLYYYTELSGNRERIITKIHYDLGKQQIDKYAIIEDVASNENNISSSFLEYKII